MTRGRSSKAAHLAAALCLSAFGLVGTATPTAAAGAVRNADCTYRLTVLKYPNKFPTPPGQRVFGMGQILGSDSVDSFAGWRYWFVREPRTFGYVGVIWTNGTELHLEGTATEEVAQAFDVNRPGDAVGHVRAGVGNVHAVLWRAGAPGTPVRLAEPAGATSSTATAINDNGVIVGYATFGTGTGQTVRGLSWSVSSPGTVRDLGTAAGILTDVSAEGRVVGFTGRMDAPVSAVAGTAQAVAPLRGQTAASGGYALGSTGRFVVGRGGVTGGGTGPLLWDDGVPRTLPPLAHGPNNFQPGDPIPPAPVFPAAVNSAGLVVGNTGQRPLDRLAGGIARASYLKDGEWHALPLAEDDVDLYASNRAAAVTEDGRIGGTSSAADLSEPAIWTCVTG